MVSVLAFEPEGRDFDSRTWKHLMFRRLFSVFPPTTKFFLEN